MRLRLYERPRGRYGICLRCGRIWQAFRDFPRCCEYCQADSSWLIGAAPGELPTRGIIDTLLADPRVRDRRRSSARTSLPVADPLIATGTSHGVRALLRRTPFRPPRPQRPLQP